MVHRVMSVELSHVTRAAAEQHPYWEATPLAVVSLELRGLAHKQTSRVENRLSNITTCPVSSCDHDSQYGHVTACQQVGRVVTVSFDVHILFDAVDEEQVRLLTPIVAVAVASDDYAGGLSSFTSFAANVNVLSSSKFSSHRF